MSTNNYSFGQLGYSFISLILIPNKLAIYRVAIVVAIPKENIIIGPHKF
jgi:hypothetical protein